MTRASSLSIFIRHFNRDTALAFAVAMTTALVEAIRAVLAATRAVGGEAKAVAETGAQDVGQDVGHVLTDLEQSVAHRDHDPASGGNESTSTHE